MKKINVLILMAVLISSCATIGGKISGLSETKENGEKTESAPAGPQRLLSEEEEKDLDIYKEISSEKLKIVKKYYDMGYSYESYVKFRKQIDNADDKYIYTRNALDKFYGTTVHREIASDAKRFKNRVKEYEKKGVNLGHIKNMREQEAKLDLYKKALVGETPELKAFEGDLQAFLTKYHALEVAEMKKKEIQSKETIEARRVGKNVVKNPEYVKLVEAGIKKDHLMGGGELLRVSITKKDWQYNKDKSKHLSVEVAIKRKGKCYLIPAEIKAEPYRGAYTKPFYYNRRKEYGTVVLEMNCANVNK